MLLKAISVFVRLVVEDSVTPLNVTFQACPWGKPFSVKLTLYVFVSGVVDVEPLEVEDVEAGALTVKVAVVVLPS